MIQGTDADILRTSEVDRFIEKIKPEIDELWKIRALPSPRNMYMTVRIKYSQPDETLNAQRIISQRDYRIFVYTKDNLLKTIKKCLEEDIMNNKYLKEVYLENFEMISFGIVDRN